MATFYNQATLSYGDNVTSSNIVTGEILEVLSMTKTAVVDRYSTDGDITYVISIVNSGATAYNDLTVTDNLGAYPFGEGSVVPLSYTEGSVRLYVNGVLGIAPTVESDSPLTFSGIGVPASGNTMIIYEASVNGFAPPAEDGAIINTAELSGEGITPLMAEETVSATNEPFLTVSKSLTPTTVPENGRITYTFAIQNYGNRATVATDDVTLTDTFTPVLEAITVTYNGAVLTAGTDYTYDNTTGEFATVPGALSVPAASFTQSPESGAWNTSPGVGILTVSGNI